MNHTTTEAFADASPVLRDNTVAIRKIIYSLVKRRARASGLERESDDLVQDGWIGALQAAEKWDPAIGASFPQYAYTRIRGAMYDGERSRDRIKRNQRRAGIDAATVSIDCPLPGESRATSWAELITAAQPDDSLDHRDEAEHHMRRRYLSRTHRLALDLYYGRELQVRQVGEALGFSAARANQILNEAFASLGVPRPLRPHNNRAPRTSATSVYASDGRTWTSIDTCAGECRITYGTVVRLLSTGEPMRGGVRLSIEPWGSEVAA